MRAWKEYRMENELGADSVEYALLTGFLGAAVITVLSRVSPTLQELWLHVVHQLA